MNIIYFIFSSSLVSWWRYIMHINYSKLEDRLSWEKKKLLQNSGEGVLVQSLILCNEVTNKILFEEVSYLTLFEKHKSLLDLSFSSYYRRTMIQRGYVMNSSINGRTLTGDQILVSRLWLCASRPCHALSPVEWGWSFSVFQAGAPISSGDCSAYQYLLFFHCIMRKLIHAHSSVLSNEWLQASSVS